MGPTFFSIIYKKIVKPIFFLFDAESVHNLVSFLGELMGKSVTATITLEKLFGKKHPSLKQKIVGIDFESPVGLAAGFDYEAKLTQILPSLGFGFNTVGTITNLAYGGNPRPMLVRLPKSKSLMVNKGFKNKGARWTTGELSKLDFKIPLGISIGKSNFQEVATQKTAIEDILKAYSVFEKSNIKNAYYEINISCPNLSGRVTFYPPDKLDELLTGTDGLRLKKPLFVKMPIDKKDKEVLAMLDVIAKHNVKGVIFGNVQTNRSDPTLDPSEVAKFKHGNFSGKPTEKRSNELIALSYKNYGKKLVIVGCGGVFSAQDAYKKIKLGASLIQLITGLIYEGPLLVSDINKKLPDLLKKDGFKNISEAIGEIGR